MVFNVEKEEESEQSRARGTSNTSSPAAIGTYTLSKTAILWHALVGLVLVESSRRKAVVHPLNQNLLTNRRHSQVDMQGRQLTYVNQYTSNPLAVRTSDERHC
jgi:hypothetical protein